MDTKGKIELKKAFNIPKNQNNDQSILIIFDSFNFGSLSSRQQSGQSKILERKKRFLLLEALINHFSVWGLKSTGILPKLKLTEVPCHLGHPVNFEF